MVLLRFGQTPRVGPQTSTATARRTRSKILVVDDNFDLAQTMTRVLRLYGHEVHTAYDGPSAVEAALEHRPEVIFLDIGLPGMDGYQVARRLRDEGLSDTLITAVTGYGQDEDRRRSMEAGFDHHLVKPVPISVIISLLSGLDGSA